MRLVRIEIERFKGLRRLDLAINSGLQLIAGPNNAGKTTVFKALEFFFNPAAFSIDDVSPENTYYAQEGARALTRVRVHIDALTAAQRNTLADSLLVRSQRVWAEVRMSRTGKLSFEASGTMAAREVHEQIVESHQVVHVPAVRVDRGIAGVTDAERLSQTILDVLVRTRPGPRSEAQRLFERRARSLLSVLSSVLEQSKGPITDLIPDGQHVGFQMPDLGGLLEAAMARVEITPQAGTAIRLRDEGTGIQSLLSLGILKYSIGGNRGLSRLFLVEEPEAFLHPQLQRAVSKHLQDLAARAQVIATTHSPVLVDAVDLRSVCRLKRDPLGLQYSWQPAPLTDSVAGQLSRFCDAKNSELVFARRVILCEGTSDVGAIEALLGDTLRNTSVVETGGATNAARFVKLARHFQIPHLVVLDKDQVVGNRDTLRQIANASGTPFLQADLDALDRAAQGVCRNSRQAEEWRQRVQPLLDQRGIYCLGNDIEGAVALSYARPRLLEWLGPGRIGHLSAESVAECTALEGARLRSRLRQLVGSKGWNTEQAVDGNKLKPHVPRAVVSALGRPRGASDLASLKRRLTQFISTNS